MRELKFRVWDSIDRQMFYDTTKELTSVRVIDGKIFVMRIGGFFNEGTPIWTEEKSVIVMQYTGLKDKKGKEIFEGDIIKAREKDTKPYTAPIIWGKVIFQDDIAQFSVYQMPFYALQELEVIGNIYEHPSLLESRNEMRPM